MTEKTCLNCNRTAELIPLISLEYRGVSYAICRSVPCPDPQTQNLAGKLPGVRTCPGRPRYQFCLCRHPASNSQYGLLDLPNRPHPLPSRKSTRVTQPHFQARKMGEGATPGRKTHIF
jgi:hypothetical protein